MISTVITSYILVSIGVGIDRFIDQHLPGIGVSHGLIEAGKAAFAWPYELYRVIRDK